MEVRENFCGACLAIPLALGGVGAVGLATRTEYYSRKWVIILSFLIMFVILLIFYINKNKCTTCTW